jgi:hypothetical protein
MPDSEARPPLPGQPDRSQPSSAQRVDNRSARCSHDQCHRQRQDRFIRELSADRRQRDHDCSERSEEEGSRSPRMLCRFLPVRQPTHALTSIAFGANARSSNLHSDHPSISTVTTPTESRNAAMPRTSGRGRRHVRLARGEPPRLLAKSRPARGASHFGGRPHPDRLAPRVPGMHKNPKPRFVRLVTGGLFLAGLVLVGLGLVFDPVLLILGALMLLVAPFCVLFLPGVPYKPEHPVDPHQGLLNRLSAPGPPPPTCRGGKSRQ